MLGIFNEEVREVRDVARVKKFREERKLRNVEKQIAAKQQEIIEGRLDSMKEFNGLRRELTLLERDKMICKRNIKAYSKAIEATTIKGIIKETEVGKAFMSELKRIERKFAVKVLNKVEDGKIKL